MPHYQRVGNVPRKRHTLHVHDGNVAFEELMGAEGFSGASTLLYHRHSPSAIVRVEPVAESPAIAAATCWPPNHPLRPHHLRTGGLQRASDESDAVQGRQPLLANDDVEVSFVAAAGTSPLYR